MGRQTVIVSVLANTSNFKRGMGDVASTLGGLGSKLGGMAKTGVAAVGAIGAAIAGIAAKKGISRALAIEDAQAKLRALGADVATVTQVSKDALAAVKGTAFGLDAAATTAASALAAQIKPGKDLQRYLGIVADTAQIAGTSMEEMGSIFGKVATNQKVTTQEMNQLADRGIPIWKYLSESMGVTTDELRKMVSDGKVSLEDFLGAVEKNIGGAGRVMADTTRGAWANTLAALGRLGAVAVGPIFPHFKTVLQQATIGIDAVTSALAPAADAAAEFLGPKLSALIDGSGQRFADWITGIPARLTAIGDAIAPVIDSIRDRLSGAGGIGGALFSAFLRYEYGFVCTILATVIAIIVLGEVAVNAVRKALDV